MSRDKARQVVDVSVRVVTHDTITQPEYLVNPERVTQCHFVGKW
jgi:hypothetical protein